MEKEMLEMIFTYINQLGAEGAEVFKYYLVAVYGIGLINSLLVAAVIIFITMKLYKLFRGMCTSSDCLKNIAITLGEDGFKACSSYDRDHLMRKIRTLKK